MHHVGIATTDAAGFVARWADVLDLRVVHEERHDGLAVVFLASNGRGSEQNDGHESGDRGGRSDGRGSDGDERGGVNGRSDERDLDHVGDPGGEPDRPAGGHVELLEPVGDGDGAETIRRFLDRDGPGLHHVAFGVTDLAGVIERARAVGIDVASGPRPGAWGAEVAFLEPTDGVLIELVE